MKQFLSAGRSERIHHERLSGYAPDLNPDEGIWHYLKHVELRNVLCADLEEHRYELRLATMRLRQKPHDVSDTESMTFVEELGLPERDAKFSAARRKALWQ